MDRETLKALQAPVKQLYQSSPEAALAELHADGVIDFDQLSCCVAIPANDGKNIIAGLHPKVGGDGTVACSGEILLQALVTCAGTTLAAVSTSMGLVIRTATIRAIGIMDFRGTLGVDRSVPVGFTRIELKFELDSDSEADQLDKLIQLTERYCVVLQTLKIGVPVNAIRI
ncbi:MAG TPA: OsmC family protein [Planctomycetaceae bacterium]|nr:OsmC family protein [Planctomycetaceae bacterium]